MSARKAGVRLVVLYCIYTRVKIWKAKCNLIFRKLIKNDVIVLLILSSFSVFPDNRNVKVVRNEVLKGV